MSNVKDVFVLTGAGSIGIAIARRIGIGNILFLQIQILKMLEENHKYSIMQDLKTLL